MSEERAIEFWNKDTNEGAYITARRNTHEEFWVVEVELSALVGILARAGFREIGNEPRHYKDLSKPEYVKALRDKLIQERFKEVKAQGYEKD